MARTETWFDQDLKKPVSVRIMAGMQFSEDNQGSLIGVRVYDDGADATLTGGATGYCILADGQTITVDGTREGNMAYILLPQSALLVPGPIQITIKLVDDGVITTLLACVGTVIRTKIGVPVVPASVIEEWSEQISETLQDCVDDCQAAADAMGANLAATYSSSATYPVGSYVIQSGTLYRCTTAVTTAGSWSTNSGKFTAVKLGNDVADLKSAIDFSQEHIQGSYFRIKESTGELKTYNYTGFQRSVIVPTKAGEKYYIHASMSPLTNYIIKPYFVFNSAMELVEYPDSMSVNGIITVTNANAAYIAVSNRTVDNGGEELTFFYIDQRFKYLDNEISDLGKTANLGDKYVDGSYYRINSTTNKLETYDYSGFERTCLIPVSTGEKFFVKATMGEVTGYLARPYLVFDSNMALVEYPESLSVNGIITVTNQNAAFIAFNNYDRDNGGEKLTVYFVDSQSYDQYKKQQEINDLSNFIYSNVNLADKYVDGSYYRYNSSTDTLSTYNYSGFERTCLIPVSTGDKFYIRATMGEVSGYITRPYLVLNSDMELVEYPEELSIAGVIMITDQNAAYLAVSNYDKNNNGDKLTIFPVNSEQYNLFNGVIARFYTKTARIFKKVVCCGDSYTAGYIWKDGTEYETNEEFAWPHFMSTLTGNNWVNCGCSGCNVLTWQVHSRGLPKAQAQGKSQAYVIGLMINDQGTSSRHVDLGTVADIGTDAQTYYGGMSKIIRELNAISPTAKIFVNTCPKTGENYADYNQAVRDIVNAYKGTYPVHCIDLNKYKYLYEQTELAHDAYHGHHTAIGYEIFSDLYMLILSNYINANYTKFRDVFSIEYDE